MEAWRFGFDLPPSYKFDPTDTDIVVHYLLRRALGLPNPHEHAVIDGDPNSCPPWEFMSRNGHADSDHAFFFPPPRALGKRAADRRVPPPAAGRSGEEDRVRGKWDTQKSIETSVVLVRGGGGGGAGSGAEMTIKYRRCHLSYYHGGEPSTSGWVMHEFQIIAPSQLSGAVLARVRVTDRGKEKHRQLLKATGDRGKQVAVGVPEPDQPGPSNYDDGNGSGSLSGGEQPEVVYLDDGDGVMAEMTGYYVDDGSSYLNDGYGYFDHEYGGGAG